PVRRHIRQPTVAWLGTRRFPNKEGDKENVLEYINIESTNLVSSRIGLGTWAIGGWMWGGTDEKESIHTIHQALDQGINLIDTAPVYGYGRSEEIVGKALRQYGR